MEIRFQGIMPPVTTPFTSQGEVHLEALERNLQAYLKTDLSGFLLVGSNGESPHLTTSEKLQIIRLAQSIISADRNLLVGSGFATLRDSLKFLEQLSGSRVDAVMVGTPSYYKNRMDRSALTGFYLSLAEESPFPLLLYNIPQFSGIELAPEMVGELASHPRIIGMKDSSGNLIYLQRVLFATRGREFQVVLGSALLLAAGLQLGIRAAILAIACACPELPLRMMEQYSKGDGVSALQSAIFRASEAVSVVHGISGIKFAMDLLGLEGGACRLPLLPLNISEEQIIRAAVEEWQTAIGLASTMPRIS